MALVFVTCFAFWLILSGHPTPLYLALGVLASALVAVAWRDEAQVIAQFWRILPRFVAYVPWLLWQIVRANIDVARLVLHPRLPIDPVVVQVPAPGADDLAVTTYANSITLTPGTVTVDVEEDTLVVHALTAGSADDLAAGEMARRIARVFGERRR